MMPTTSRSTRSTSRAAHGVSRERRVAAGLDRSQSSDQFLLRKGSGGPEDSSPVAPMRSPPPPKTERSSSDVGGFRLGRKEKTFLIQRARESAQALIDHAHTLDGPVQWHYKGNHRGIQMYRGESLVLGDAGHETDALEFLCGVTTMMGTLDEVSEYFDQSSTARMRMRKAEDVLDCAVLHALVTGNTVNPFHRIAVKYVAYAGPNAMARDRDFCYLECQDTFRHASGRRAWVLSMHSIRLPSCPERTGFVRGSLYHSGFVFVEAERPGYMDVMHSLQINYKGASRIPHFLLNAALKRRIRELIRISREIQVARLAHRTLLKEKELTPKHLRTACVNCDRRFWLLLRKTRCRACGEVVCQACAPEIDWEPTGGGGQQPSAPMTKTRICIRCYSSAPKTGTWTANRETGPWTEASRIKKSTGNATSSHRARSKSKKKQEPASERVMPKVIEESSPPEEIECEGRFTFHELEEQSSISVFAPERFTRSSMASMGVPLDVDQISIGFEEEDGMSSFHSTEYKWQSRATDDSTYHHVGSFSSSIMSRDSYFGRDEPSSRLSRRPNATIQIDDTPVLMEEPEDDQVSHVNRSSRRGKASPSDSKSNFEFLDGLIDMPLNKTDQGVGKTRRRAHTVGQTEAPRARSELNATTLRAHNLRYQHDDDQDQPPTVGAPAQISYANEIYNLTPPLEDVPVRDSPRSSEEPFSLDDVVGKASFDTTVSSVDFDNNSLFARPSSLILQQVRKNRSRTIQLQSHNEDDYRTTEVFQEVQEAHQKRMEELNRKAMEYTGHRVSTLEARESLKPTDVVDDVWRSSEQMEEYRSRRKDTINALRRKAMCIQEESRGSSCTDRTTASSRSPSFGGHKTHGIPSESAPHGFNLSEDLSFHPSVSMDEAPESVGNPSISREASFSEVTERKRANGTPSAQPEKELEPKKPSSPANIYVKKEFVSARSLYAEIGELTKLQSEMAEASGDDEVEAIKGRIRDQYQLIRQLKLQS